MPSSGSATAPVPAGRGSTAFLGITLATFFGASSAPTPLYRVYQEAFAVSPVLMTIVFAVYAVTLLAALLVAGSLSDHLGRRPVVFGALLLEILAMAVFLAAGSAPWLIVARALQGIATGIACASIGAALLDVDRLRGPFVNTIAPLIGMAAGAVGTSALVQYGPSPLHLVYALLLLAFVAEAFWVWRTAETGGARPGALASLAPRIAVPAQARRPLALVTPINVATWALGGFYLSLVPSLVVATTGHRAPLTGGTVVAVLMVAGAGAIGLRRTGNARANLVLGAAILTLGTLMVVAGVHAASVPVLVLGTLLSGFGFGTSFLGAVGAIVPLARPAERAELLSAYYIQSYLAFSVPAVLAGYLIDRLGYTTTADVYAAVIVLLNLIGIVGLRIGGAATEDA